MLKRGALARYAARGRVGHMPDTKSMPSRALLSNASWGQLAAEFLRAKDNSDTLKVFANTILGQPWHGEGDELEEGALAKRVEPFSLEAIPPEVLAITFGVDVQGDRLEASVVGWAATAPPLCWRMRRCGGRRTATRCGRALDDLLRQRWRHPHGGLLKVDAAAIDAGSGSHYDIVLAFCTPRLGRKVFAIKGVPGFARPAIARAKIKGASRCSWPASIRLRRGCSPSSSAGAGSGSATSCRPSILKCW